METLNVMNLRRTKKSATRLPKPYIRKMLKSQTQANSAAPCVTGCVKSQVTVWRSADKNGHCAEGRSVEPNLVSSEPCLEFATRGLVREINFVALNAGAARKSKLGGPKASAHT
jgi:hypothetical protein